MSDDAPYSPSNPWIPARERTPPPMDHEAGGKLSAFSWEMGGLILARIEAGETVKQVCADPRMPSYATFYRWTRVEPEFGAALREVRVRVAWWRQRSAEEQARWAPYWAAHRRRLAGKPPRGWVSGRRSTFRACVAMQVIWRIEEGASLSEVVRTPGMPSFKAVYRWMRRFPWFRAQYMEACYWREHADSQRAWDAAIDALNGDPRGGRRCDAIRGRIGRVRPKRYLNWS